MKNEKNRNSSFLQLKWDVAYRRLVKELPEQILIRWIKKFTLVELTENRAVLTYSGTENLEDFDADGREKVRNSLSWAVGYEVDVQYRQMQKRASSGKEKKRKKGHRMIGMAAVLLVAVLAFLTIPDILRNRNFKETFYQIGSEKVDGRLRIIQLSDLHNTEYGKDNETLLHRITLLQPDMIVMSGDMVDQRDKSADMVVELCSKLVEIAPVYYIYGNNEATKYLDSRMTLEILDEELGGTEEERSLAGYEEKDGGLKVLLESVGVHVLWNEMETITVRGIPIDIYGVLTSNPSAFWPYAGESFQEFTEQNQEHLKLMAIHEPYIFEEFQEGQWADLILCGHTHGGVMRFPYLGGIYERKNGIFPELKEEEAYIYGKYELGEKPLIVSSGLTNRGWLRFQNQPELVIVDLSRY